MSQNFVPGLEPSHRFGPDLVIRSDYPLRGVVDWVLRIAVTLKFKPCLGRCRDVMAYFAPHADCFLSDIAG